MKLRLGLLVIALAFSAGLHAQVHSASKVVVKKSIVVAKASAAPGTDSVAISIGDRLGRAGLQLLRTTRGLAHKKEGVIFYDTLSKHVWLTDGTRLYRLAIDSTITP